MVAGVLWVGEWQAAQRQAPELAELVEALEQQGSRKVADILKEHSAARAAPRQAGTVDRTSPADYTVVSAPWADVETDVFPARRHDGTQPTDALRTDRSIATASDSVELRVTLDVMLVHHMLPLAVGMSPQRLAEARADVLAAAGDISCTSSRSSAANAEQEKSAMAVSSALAAACEGDGACEVADSAGGRLLVKLPLQRLAAAVEALAAQPAVHWLSLHVPPRAANYYGEPIGPFFAAGYRTRLSITSRQMTSIEPKQPHVLQQLIFGYKAKVQQMSPGPTHALPVPVFTLRWVHRCS